MLSRSAEMETSTVSPAVEMVGLHKHYLASNRFWQRRRPFAALTGVDLRVEAGEIFGLVGRNGYGKTTLIRCVAGLIMPSAGQVRVYGKDTVRDDLEVRRLIGWVGAEERSFYLRLTARQNLLFFARLQGLADAVALARMDAFAERFQCADLLERRVHELSTGNRQRFSIIRALIHAPRLLILDEPTRSLDPFAADDLRKILRDWVSEDARRSILITSHHLHEIEAMSDRIAIMGKGRLGAVGTFEELRTKLGGGQRVEIAFQPSVGEPELTALCQAEPRLQWRSNQGGSLLFFRREAGDEFFDHVLRQCQKRGFRIEQVTTNEISLQEMIDRLAESSDTASMPSQGSELHVAV